MEAADILRDRVRELERQLEERAKKVDDLEKDNAKQREELREARGEVETLSKRVPSENSVVLGKADAERWNVAKELIDTVGGVDKLQTLQTERDRLQTELKERDRKETIRDAGYDPRKLERLLGGASLRLQGEGDERSVKVVLRDSEGNETERLIDEWAEAEGISDLLNVAKNGTTQETPKPRPHFGAGERPPKSRVPNADELARDKQGDPKYRM